MEGCQRGVLLQLSASPVLYVYNQNVLVLCVHRHNLKEFISVHITESNSHRLRKPVVKQQPHAFRASVFGISYGLSVQLLCWTSIGLQHSSGATSASGWRMVVWL
jgi:hypothetical protein